MLSGSLGADALTAITTLGFTFMALDCFDALLNWTNEHSLVKAIVTGSSSSNDVFTDEQLAATVIQRYFESNPDLLPTAQGRRFFTFVGFQERAIVTALYFNYYLCSKKSRAQDRGKAGPPPISTFPLALSAYRVLGPEVENSCLSFLTFGFP